MDPRLIGAGGIHHKAGAGVDQVERQVVSGEGHAALARRGIGDAVIAERGERR
jgi:hypothetical protein